MTRAPGPDDEIDYASAGVPGAERVVVVLRTGALAQLDPHPSATRARGVRLVLVHLEGPELADPPAFGGETPAESTVAALARIAERESPDRPVALVAERHTCAIALSLAAALGPRVDRLVLVAPAIPDEALERDLSLAVLPHVDAATLAIGATTDAATVDAAAWYAGNLPHAATAVVPESGIDTPDGRLGSSDAWPTVLEHVARSRGFRA